MDKSAQNKLGWAAIILAIGIATALVELVKNH